MASKISNGDLIAGIVLVVIGAMLLLDRLAVPALALIAAIGLVCVGALILLDRMNGPQWAGALCLVLGVAMLVSDQVASGIAGILHIVIGGACLAAGILKLIGRW